MIAFAGNLVMFEGEIYQSCDSKTCRISSLFHSAIVVPLRRTPVSKVVFCRIPELHKLAANLVNRDHHWHQARDRTEFQATGGMTPVESRSCGSDRYRLKPLSFNQSVKNTYLKMLHLKFTFYEHFRIGDLFFTLRESAAHKGGCALLPHHGAFLSEPRACITPWTLSLYISRLWARNPELGLTGPWTDVDALSAAAFHLHCSVGLPVIGLREPLKSVTCSLVTALDYLVITWVYLNYLDLGVWSSVVCTGSRVKGTASPLSLGKLWSVCVICAQLSPVTSERDTCTSQQTALNPCSLPLHRGQIPLLCFITTNKKLTGFQSSVPPSESSEDCRQKGKNQEESFSRKKVDSLGKVPEKES
ncbi:hypothetical protein EK904_005641 [Melospiza melodia maxima]|nr:hypothetical protein EK904_005641 [Melospiza melodia maxima]